MKFNITKPGTLHYESGVLVLHGWHFDTDPPSRMTDVQMNASQIQDMTRDILIYIANEKGITLVSVEAVYEASKALHKASKK